MAHKFTATVEADLTTLAFGFTPRSDPEADPSKLPGIRKRAELLVYEGKDNKYTCTINVETADLPATLIIDTRGLFAKRSVKVVKEGAAKPLLDVSGQMGGRAEYILKLTN